MIVENIRYIGKLPTLELKKKVSITGETLPATSSETELLTLFPTIITVFVTPVIAPTFVFSQPLVRKHRQVKLLPRSIHQPSTAGYTVYLYTSFLPPSSSWRRDSWHIFIPVDGNTVLECRTGRRHHAVTRIRHRARCSSGSITGGGMDGRVTVKSNGN